MATHPAVVPFTVRVSDSAVDVVATPAVQLHVDTTSRTIHFVQPTAVRESYTCVKVSAQPQSRAGMVLTIQPHHARAVVSRTRFLKFNTAEARDRCVATLELMESAPARDTNRSGVNVDASTRVSANANNEERDVAQCLDRAMLNKQLKAERHLIHADQATLVAWKLIGGDPDAEAACSQQLQRNAEHESGVAVSHLATTNIQANVNLATKSRAPPPPNSKTLAMNGVAPCRGAASSMLSDDATATSLLSPRIKSQWSIMADNFTPLPGEAMLEHVQRVTNLVTMSQSDRAVQGVLKITTFRITFSPYDSSWTFGSFDVPLSALDVITRDGLMLLIACKDLRTIRLAMHDAYTKKKGYVQLPSTPDSKWLNLLVQRMRPPTNVNALFAFDFFCEKKARMMAKPENRKDGWLLYSPVAEFQRLGFLRGADSLNRMHGVEPNVITWRLLKNSKFRFSPTYPQLMVVPSLMTEEQLVQLARFRSHARLPVVVWRHPVNKALRDAAKKNTVSNAPPLHIIDARELFATKGNQVKGKGVENPQHYDNAVVEFVGIANIHKMRESFDALKSLVLSNGNNFYSRLEKTKWLRHVGDILAGARRVAEILHDDGASVLVHCSDGWNRTPQLVSLAQLMLDPYYRTIRGFAVLIEKEWCSFGHKFRDRIGVGKDTTDERNERSPVILQFLDCVWQLTRQFPTAFEFSEALLLHVWDALLSGLYGTFLYNTERERIFEKVWVRTESAWTPVLENPQAFTNSRFKATDCILSPRTDESRIVLWEAMAFRWDAERQRYHSDPSLSDLLKTSDRSVLHFFDNDSESARRRETGEVHTCGAMVEGSPLGNQGEETEVAASKTPHASGCGRHGDAIDDLSEGSKQQSTALVSERYARGVDQRARQRSQAGNIRDALTMAPDASRIKYLEQLLSESLAREVALEGELSGAQRSALRRSS